MFHQSFYPHQQTFPNNRAPPHLFTPSNGFFYRPNGPILNHSTHNLNFHSDFERFSVPNHGYPSMFSGGYQFFDWNNPNFDQQRWRQNFPRPPRQQQQQPHRRTPIFQFQDGATTYYMTDPIITNDDRITIQLTKVHTRPNGDQQRVFVEQEFSNQTELNKFVRNFRQNYHKTFNNRSSGASAQTDETNSTDSKKSGVVVVEEPDEEPKVYQQQAYNANIESKKAAAAFMTPPTSPVTQSTSPPKLEDHSQLPNREHQRTKHTSPPASRMSSTSTTRSTRRHRNKMKYRRQQADNREAFHSSRVFPMPGYSHQYRAIPIPPRFQQRAFTTSHDFRTKNQFHTPPFNLNSQWTHHHNEYPKARSRSYVPPTNGHFPRPPTPSHLQYTANTVFQPMPTDQFTHQRQKPFRPPPPPSPAKFHRPQHSRVNQPTTIAETFVYPNTEQQQPRVQRTRSECRPLQAGQPQRNRSTINHFQNFGPSQRQTPVMPRHSTFVRPPPLIPPTTLRSTAPIFYPNQNRQAGNIQTPLRFINHFRLGTNRF